MPTIIDILTYYPTLEALVPHLTRWEIRNIAVCNRQTKNILIGPNTDRGPITSMRFRNLLSITRCAAPAAYTAGPMDKDARKVLHPELVAELDQPCLDMHDSIKPSVARHCVNCQIRICDNCRYHTTEPSKGASGNAIWPDVQLLADVQSGRLGRGNLLEPPEQMLHLCQYCLDDEIGTAEDGIPIFYGDFECKCSLIEHYVGDYWCRPCAEAQRQAASQRWPSPMDYSGTPNPYGKVLCEGEMCRGTGQTIYVGDVLGAAICGWCKGRIAYV